MNTTTINSYEEFKKTQEENRRKLLSLPSYVGVKDIPSLIVALKRVNGKLSGRGRRLDTTTREAIVADLKAGIKGSEVMKRYNVSLPTVYMFKKTLKLVKPHRPLNPFVRTGLIKRLQAKEKDTAILKAFKGLSISQLRKVKDELGLIKTRKTEVAEEAK